MVHIVYYCDSWTEMELFTGQTDFLSINVFKGQRMPIRKMGEDTVVVFSNYKTKEIFGTCRLRFWSTSCLKFIGQFGCGQESYQIGIQDVRLFSKGVKYSDVQLAVDGIHLTKKGNMWKRGRNCIPVYQTGDKGGVVAKRFRLFISGLK